MFIKLALPWTAQAEELAEDMRSRRRRSVASILGRVQLSEEEEYSLLAGTAPVSFTVSFTGAQSGDGWRHAESLLQA